MFVGILYVFVEIVCVFVIVELVVIVTFLETAGGRCVVEKWDFGMAFEDQVVWLAQALWYRSR